MVTIEAEATFQALNEQLAERQLSEPELLRVGNLALLDAGRTPSLPQGTRPHLLVGAEVDGFRHRMWVTQPSAELDAQLTVVTQPGLGEIIEKGIGSRFHDQLATRLPGALVITHATHGVGHSADRFRFSDLPTLGKHGLDYMAEQVQLLLEAYCHAQRVVYVGKSMGTVIGNKTMRLNTEKGKPTDIVGVVYVAPALVDPTHVLRSMGIKFTPNLAMSIGNQLLAKTSPKYLLATIKDLYESRPEWRDLPPMLRQIYDILHGTPESEVDEVLTEYLVAVVAGVDDAINELAMWKRKDSEFSNFLLEPVRGRGHDIATDPYRATKKISKIIVQMGLYPDGEDLAA